ncbi:uncharacterized protein [Narcine bancroftii]|uniref:uncharacterized protein n=1 Tax=Narcine bancroftii TaxID=1343680 RepID=UPI003831AE84
MQNNHTMLQRVNQDLETKLHRMTQLHEKEKRNFNHKVNILSSHLMEAKITIEKLTGDNPQVPEETQHVGEYTKKFGCGLCGTECELPISEIQTHILENPEPICLPGSPTPGSSSGHVFLKYTDKIDQGSQFKTNLFCSDTALYRPAEQRRGRSKVRDVQGRSAGFFRSQSFSDSVMEVEDFSTSPLSEPPPNYSPSTSTFSNYLNCTTKAKKGIEQTTMNPTQNFQCCDTRGNIYERKCSISQGYRNNKSIPDHTGPRQFKDITHDDTQHTCATLPTLFNNSLNLSTISTQQRRASKLYNDQRDICKLDKITVGQCRKINTHYSDRIPKKNSSRSCTDTSLLKRITNQVNLLCPTSREDNFLDLDHNNFIDSTFRATSENDGNNVGNQIFQMSMLKDTENNPKTLPSENNSNQTCIKNVNSIANIQKRVDVAPTTSVDSSLQYPFTLFVVHNVPLDNGALNSKDKSSKINGLYRKDSLTKAQLYGNLLN